MENQYKIYGRILFPGVENNVIEKPADIMFCKADDHYIDIYFKNGKHQYQAVCLKYLENKLRSLVFFRTHRSFIVNLRFVKCYRKNKRGLIIVIKNGQEIPVSKLLKKGFEEKIKCFPAIMLV